MSRPSEEQLRLKKEREEAEEAAEEAMDDYEDCLQMNRPKEERLEALLQVRDTKCRQLEAMERENQLVNTHNANMAAALVIIQQRLFDNQ